jgi:hypothetical protein
MKNGFRYRYLWRATTVGAVLVVLVGTPVMEQVREHLDHGTRIEHRAARHDHGFDGSPPLRIPSPQVVAGTASLGATNLYTQRSGTGTNFE